MNADDENHALCCWLASPRSIRVRGGQTRAGIRDSGSDGGAGGGAGVGGAWRPEALYVGRCRGGATAGAGSPAYARWVGWLARTYCRVVGHTGDWAYPDERCVRVQMCERCREVINKQEHTWTAFEYVVNKRCEQERRCDRCSAVQSRVVHEWGPWLYAGTEQHFRQCHTCRRCGEEEFTRYMSRIG
jgi:hypothetical protein